MVNDQKNDASPEKREELINVLGSSIKESTLFLETLLVEKKALKEVTITREIKVLNAFVDLGIFVNYVNIELSSITRACLRAKILAEKQYNLKFINCIILESYKYLYGYGKGVKKSFWIKNIAPIRKVVNDPQVIEDLEKIEKLIIEFRDCNITNKDNRDLSIHYDLDPFLIYDMLRELNEYDEIQRVLAFLPLFSELHSFANGYILKHIRQCFVDPRFQEEIKRILTPKRFSYFDTGLASSLDKKIIGNKKYIDWLISKQKGIQQLAMQEKDNVSVEPLHLTSQILKVQTFIYLLIIDLYSATKTFIMSEYSIEKQLCLKHINTIIYEGFNKLYGVDNNEGTYWDSYILQVENKLKSVLNERLSDQLNQKLQILRPTIKGFAEQRKLSVHLEDGIEEIYYMLVNLKPIVELQKPVDFTETIIQVLFQLLSMLNLIDKQLDKDSKSIRLNTIQTAEKILAQLKKSPDCQEKEEKIQLMQQMISGELFDNLNKKLFGKKGL